MVFLKMDPALAHVHSDPRFAGLTIWPAFLPGLTDRPIQRLPNLRPAAWAT
jgi:hypothetical protein